MKFYVTVVCRFVVADEVLPGILEYLDKLLSREHISQELEEVRQRYVAILQCTSTESPEVVRKNVATLAESLSLKYEAGSKSGKFGRIREKRLINIRQVCLNNLLATLKRYSRGLLNY